MPGTKKTVPGCKQNVHVVCVCVCCVYVCLSLCLPVCVCVCLSVCRCLNRTRPQSLRYSRHPHMYIALPLSELKGRGVGCPYEESSQLKTSRWVRFVSGGWQEQHSKETMRGSPDMNPVLTNHTRGGAVCDSCLATPSLSLFNVSPANLRQQNAQAHPA